MILSRPAGASSEAGRKISHYGAICVRGGDDQLEVLLITSRDSGRWVIPKGRPMSGRKAHQVAKLEAWEEAGVRGRANKRPCGVFGYGKTRGSGEVEPCVVQVHVLFVSALSDNFPEKGMRTRRWFSPADAAAAVVEPELQDLMRALAAA